MSQTALFHLWKNSKLIPNETFYILICNALRREIILCWKTYCNIQIHVSCGSAPITFKTKSATNVKNPTKFKTAIFPKKFNRWRLGTVVKRLRGMIWYYRNKNHHFSNKVLNAVEVHVIINNKTKFISIYILLSNFYVHQNAFP